jgi:mono/diheme cytochrome c family protein
VSLRWLALGSVAVALLTVGAGAALVSRPPPPSPRGPEPGRTLFQAHCATCHGAAGRGDSWRARLLFLRPGDLSSPAMASLPDRYLADLIRHGGSSFGKPGMPSFGFVLTDSEVEAVIQYIRTLPRVPHDVAETGSGQATPAAAMPDQSTHGAGSEAGRPRGNPLVATVSHALVDAPSRSPESGRARRPPRSGGRGRS